MFSMLFVIIKRTRTHSKYIYFGLYLYFSGLSLRKTSEILSYFIKRNHVSIWNWIQKSIDLKEYIKQKKKDFRICHIDETIIKVGSEFIWLWIAIEPIRKEILRIDISI